MSISLVVKTKVLIVAHDTTTNTLVKIYFQGKERKKKSSSRKHKNQVLKGQLQNV